MASEPGPAAANGRCAACGAAFHCGVADAQPCWCTRIEVDPAKLAALVAPDAGCLCPDCLLRTGKARSPDPHA